MTPKAIQPDTLYTPAEAAQLLRLERRAMYRIGPDELPAHYVGPRRGTKVYWGADLLAYIAKGRRTAA